MMPPPPVPAKKKRRNNALDTKELEPLSFDGEERSLDEYGRNLVTFMRKYEAEISSGSVASVGADRRSKLIRKAIPLEKAKTTKRQRKKL